MPNCNPDKSIYPSQSTNCSSTEVISRQIKYGVVESNSMSLHVLRYFSFNHSRSPKKPRRPEPPFPGLALHFCCHGSNRLGVTRDDNSKTSVEYIDPRPQVTLWYSAEVGKRSQPCRHSRYFFNLSLIISCQLIFI